MGVGGEFKVDSGFFELCCRMVSGQCCSNDEKMKNVSFFKFECKVSRGMLSEGNGGQSLIANEFSMLMQVDIQAGM